MDGVISVVACMHGAPLSSLFTDTTRLREYRTPAATVIPELTRFFVDQAAKRIMILVCSETQPNGLWCGNHHRLMQVPAHTAYQQLEAGSRSLHHIPGVEILGCIVNPEGKIFPLLTVFNRSTHKVIDEEAWDELINGGQTESVYERFFSQVHRIWMAAIISQNRSIVTTDKHVIQISEVNTVILNGSGVLPETIEEFGSVDVARAIRLWYGEEYDNIVIAWLSLFGEMIRKHGQILSIAHTQVESHFQKRTLEKAVIHELMERLKTPRFFVNP